MERDVALRLDGIVASVLGNLDCLAHHLRNNLSDEESKALMPHIGGAMGELYSLSKDLYSKHPDIVPKELGPK